MKFNLSWLKSHLNTDASLDQIVSTLTNLGIEVEQVDNPSETYKGFLLGRVEKCETHPNADRLHYCQVNIGLEELVPVVCGASNVREGMLVAFASPGAIIPSTRDVLKVGKIRGIESKGMLCSAEELDIGSGEEGILDIKTNKFPGAPLAEALGLDDPIITVSLTPNRSDLFSVRGIARDLAAAGLGILHPLSNFKIPDVYSKPVGIQTEECSQFYALWIKGVKNKPSPKLILDRLKAASITPHNMLVDITNYIALNLGQPMHVYDANKIHGALHVRFAKTGEKLSCLGGQIIELTNDDIVVADDRVLGLAGIIGGVDSSVDESTTDIILEAADFSSFNIARSGQHHNIVSEARTRFERGIDSENIQTALFMAAKWIEEVCGGSIEFFYSHKVPSKKVSLIFDLSLFEAKTGLDITKTETVTCLEKLGFECKEVNVNPNIEEIKIKVPSWRHDIKIPEDIVEELLRIKGYDRLEALSLPLVKPVVCEDKDIRLIASSLGLLECINLSLINPEKAKFFTNLSLVEIKNPIAQNMSVMRPSLIPGLLEVALYNHRRNQETIALFECGKIYESSLNENNVLAGLRLGKIDIGRWYQKERVVDIFDVKGDGLALLEALGITKVQTTRNTPIYYHPGRSGAWQQGKNIFGYFGELHPRICQEYDLPTCLIFEIFLDQIQVKKKALKAPQFSQFPPVKRDLSFIVGHHVSAEDVLNAVSKTKLVGEADVFDVYDNVSETEKAVGIRFTIASLTHTLGEEEIEKIIKEILINVETSCNGRLRPC